MKNQIKLCAVVLGIIWVTPLAASDRPASSDKAPKHVSPSVMITALRKEATEAWRKDRDWPRSEQNFAAQKGWSLTQDEALKALARRLDSNPVMDAYIKWQLLALVPDLASADIKTINRILGTMPEPLRQPEPNLENLAAGGTQMSVSFGSAQTSFVRDLEPVVGDGVAAYKPVVGVVSSGTRLDTQAEAYEMEKAVNKVNAQLESARKTIRGANRAIGFYREALIEALPPTGGTRLAVRLKDVRDRLVAGDSSCHEALTSLLDVSAELAADATLPDATRRTLVQWAQTLATIRTPVAESVIMDRKRNPTIKYSELALDKEQIGVLMGRLQTPPGNP